MVWAIISMFMGSIGQIYTKKSLNFGKSLKLNDLLQQIPTFVIFLGFFIFSGTKEYNFYGLFFIFSTVLIFGVGRFLRLYVVQREKLSFLVPYNNLSKIFTVVFAYYIFNDISTISLFIGLATIAIIMISSIDFKNIKVSHNVILYILSQLLFAIGNIILGYTLLLFSSFDYFLYYVIISTFMGFLFILVSKSGHQIKNLDKNYLQATLFGGAIGWLAWFVSLVVVEKLGLSVSTILSMLAMLATFVFSFIAFGDKPEKKDLVLSLIVGVLVGIGYYFK